MDTDDRAWTWDEIARERAATVLDRAFIAAQLGMPSEDHETAVDSLRIMVAALLVDHLAPDDDTIERRGAQRASVAEHWQRVVTTAVTHTFVLGGGFVQPDHLLDVVEQMSMGGARRGRPFDHGMLVLRVLDDLSVLGAAASSGVPAESADMEALEDLIAAATIGAVREGRMVTGRPEATDRPSRGRWSNSVATVAASFGVPDASLVAVTKDGWVCDSCGCFFAGTVEGTVAYPDRFAPIGRDGPCDATIDCPCHAAPVQRDIR